MPSAPSGLTLFSHELRTPMTSLKGAIDLLVAGSLDPMPAPLLPLLAIAHRNASRLAELVEDLLAIERLGNDRGLFDLRPVDLGVLLRQVIAMHPADAGQLRERLLLTDQAPSAMLRADAPWLLRALSRVLAGTIRAARPHLGVAISLQRDGSELCVSFAHHGPSLACLPDDGTRPCIGPMITQAIIGGHGGSISHIARPGGEKICQIRLPALVA